jgi:hypothetical protein
VASTHLLRPKETLEERIYLFNVGVEKTQAANPVDGKATTHDFQKRACWLEGNSGPFAHLILPTFHFGNPTVEGLFMAKL